jgi:hydroxyethylthiazole kinase
VVAVTGSVDYITDGTRVVAVANGTPAMAKVTAMGCALSGVVGACLGVAGDRLVTAAHALAIFGVAGELAAERAEGPGSLRVGLIDALHRLDADTLTRLASIDQ